MHYAATFLSSYRLHRKTCKLTCTERKQTHRHKIILHIVQTLKSISSTRVHPYSVIVYPTLFILLTFSHPHCGLQRWWRRQGTSCSSSFQSQRCEANHHPSVLHLHPCQSAIYSWHSVRGARLWTVGGSWCRTSIRRRSLETSQGTDTKTYCCEVTAYTFWTVLFRWMPHQDNFKMMMCVCFSIHSDIIIFLNMIYYYLHKTDDIEIRWNGKLLMWTRLAVAADEKHTVGFCSSWR